MWVSANSEVKGDERKRKRERERERGQRKGGCWVGFGLQRLGGCDGDGDGGRQMNGRARVKTSSILGR